MRPYEPIYCYLHSPSNTNILFGERAALESWCRQSAGCIPTVSQLVAEIRVGSKVDPTPNVVSVFLAGLNICNDDCGSSIPSGSAFGKEMEFIGMSQQWV